MPQQWSNKDERQYEHIKESAQERGKKAARAKEIAARTVNKKRREEGRTAAQRSSGSSKRSSSSSSGGLADQTVQQLRERARDLDISGRSHMKKSELVQAIRNHH